MKKYNINTYIDNFLVFLLIGISGIPFFFQSKNWIFIVFILSFIVFAYRRLKFEKIFYIILGILLIIFIGQVFTFGKFEFTSNLSLIIRFAIAYMIVKTLGAKFINSYCKIIFFFSIISLVFFIPYFLFSGFHTFLENFFRNFAFENEYSWRSSIIIYTLHYDYTFSRNSGAFWEPGAFGVFLNLALIFELIRNRSHRSKYAIIYIICIITTFSTAGYIAMFVILCAYFFYIYRNKFIAISFLAMPLFFYGFIVNSEILGQKITTQLEYAEGFRSGYEHVGRFGSALTDLNDIKKYPVFGKGRGEFRYEKYLSQNDFETRRSNGITDYAVKMGVPFLLIYLTFVFIFFKNYSITNGINNKIFFVMIYTAFLILAFSQILFNHPFFIGLIFLEPKKLIRNV